jgi:uncharacterized membrane protein
MVFAVNTKTEVPGEPLAYPPNGRDMAHVVERNIRALINRRQSEESQKNWEDRLADAVTRFCGSMMFVYLHLLLFGLWIGLNLPWSPWPKFDPTFVVLAMWASVEAIFLSTFVLISQNRMTMAADKRADLDLQVSLLSEHEITRLVTLVSAMAERMNIAQAQSPELDELKRDVAPEHVLDTMEKVSREQSTKSGTDSEQREGKTT